MRLGIWLRKSVQILVYNLCISCAKARDHFFPNCPMKPGRPPAWNPVANLRPGVWTDVVALGSKARVTFPPAVRQRLPWLALAGPGLLAIAEAGRNVELLPWQDAGPAMLERVRALVDAADEAERDGIALAAMDRYLRLSLDGAGRTILPAALASHLDAEIEGRVRIVVLGARLWLWSERRWDAGRARRIALLQHG